MSTPIRRALYGRMAGDTTLTNLLGSSPAGFNQSIYHQQAPEKAAFPFVIFQKSSGVPTDAFGKPSAFDSDVWMIKAVDKSPSADAAEAIAARIIALMNDAPLSISGSTLVYLRKESDIDYPELTNGDTYHHVGGLFRLMVTS